MTKKEMAEAMLAGKVLINNDGAIAFFDQEENPPFRVKYSPDHDDVVMDGYWDDGEHFSIKPELKKRPMIRKEVLGFLTNTPGVVVRLCEGPWNFIAAFDFDGAIQDYQWATITPDGKIGEPHAFEVDA